MAISRCWSILALGMLAAACGAANKPDARHAGGDAPPPEVPAEPNAFPAEPARSDAPSLDEGPGAASPPSAAAPAPSTESSSAGRDAAADAFEGEAPRARAEAKSSRRALEPSPERPGLGTSWGETRSSQVSNAPFERAGRHPFAVTTIRYNDQSGIAAMLRGGSFVDHRVDSAPSTAGALTVRLLDENGAPLPTFADGGRTLVAGEHGRRYVIEIQNRSSNRFEAVVAVDGLDVVDGRPGSFSKRGYLVQPFATVEIDGFRRSMSEVAAFRFGSVRGSYAAKKGNDRNVGVIGVAFFAERGATPPWTERELVRRESADPFPGRFASPPIAR